MGHQSLEAQWNSQASPTEDGTKNCRSEEYRPMQYLIPPYEGQSKFSDDRHQPRESAESQSEISLPTAPRRFPAQPIETLSRNSKEQQSAPTGGDQTSPPNGETSPKALREHPPPRRFLPEPVETSKTSHRRTHSASELRESTSSFSREAPGAPRRFKPNLIETDTRSVRQGGSVSHSSLHDVTRSPAKHQVICPDTTSWPDISSHASTSLIPDSQFSYSNLLRRQNARRHSFRVPDLPSIPSNSSEDSDNSSSHSACTSPPGSSNKPTQGLYSSKLRRGNGNGEISDYLLSLAARSAQEQLKEQTLAAFPNEQVYEPVDHFAIDEDDRDLAEDTLSQMDYYHVKSRRQSSADLSWELEYMRHHKEEAEMRLRAMIASGQRECSPERNRNGKSPPMHGNDIVLPQSVSPEGTMCEYRSTDAVSYGAHDICHDCDGLWCAAPDRGKVKGVGLWMGTCRKDEGQDREVQGLLPGIVTPMPRVDGAGIGMGLSPSPSHTQLNRLAASPGSHSSPNPVSPNLQKIIKSEFHDGFVTQIYNYLSLGYPCLARYYDYELSRISCISVEDLRRDDLRTDARGYIVAPEDGNIANACARWKALRLYIQEWARQEPGMAEDETNLEGWGHPERKGSWAI
ncbi:uncharacterized protein N7515_005231 [Penicillium bovifimosum]|uniref:Uncharacterized protein n=1 Tax=Penicillium bovifimosum TaxID=126998 RepID=A0A9W9GSC6_9EURO|nr:uncharacterized protein N7515_005231 [Penicillium bovifimosum]KAJ5129192.1 hypothetical protein N7515_005231 [Penicillium bovifimosum]